jgi:hypothetical protein
MRPPVKLPPPPPPRAGCIGTCGSGLNAGAAVASRTQWEAAKKQPDSSNPECSTEANPVAPDVAKLGRDSCSAASDVLHCGHEGHSAVPQNRTQVAAAREPWLARNGVPAAEHGSHPRSVGRQCPLCVEQRRQVAARMITRMWNRFKQWRQARTEKQAEELAGLSTADREVVGRGHDASRGSHGDWSGHTA